MTLTTRKIATAALIIAALHLIIAIAQNIYWLNYEREMCFDDLQDGTCRLEMDAPLEFHYYWHAPDEK